MNEVIKTINNHKSIRKFKNIPLTEEQLDVIIHAAQMAPTSAHLQPYTIIGITDDQLKEKIALQSGNAETINSCCYLFIFCADLYRITETASQEEKEKMQDNLSFDYFSKTSIVSAGIALQNANLAAESMGLGAVIIGGIARALPDLDEWLQLPSHVIPLVGLAIGVPAEFPEQKPRLPKDAVFFENQYNHNLKEKIKKYDDEIGSYYEQRTNNKQKMNWSQKNINMLTQDLTLGFYSEYVKSKGFGLK